MEMVALGVCTSKRSHLPYVLRITQQVDPESPE
jgi:hypothetical protein